MKNKNLKIGIIGLGNFGTLAASVLSKHFDVIIHHYRKRSEDIKKAKAEGRRWKLIGRAEVQPDGSFKAKVSPEKLPLSDPLAGVSEAINALTYYTDELGPVTIVGPGAGRRETGFSLLIDLLEMNRKLNN